MIKAWWLYEAELESGTREPLSSVFSEAALAVMVLALFNARAAPATPLHALALFFATYEEFPWEAAAASAQGPVPLGASSPTHSPHGALLGLETIAQFQGRFRRTAETHLPVSTLSAYSPKSRTLAAAAHFDEDDRTRADLKSK